MSETVAEVTEATEAPAEVVKPDLDELGTILAAKAAEKIEAHNELVTRVNRATGDVVKLVSEIREADTTEDETVKGFQKWVAEHDAARERAVAKIDAYIKDNLVKVEMTEDEVKAAEAKISDLAKSIKHAVAYGEDYVSGFSLHLPEVKGKVRLVKASGKSDGSPKPRVTGIYVDDVLQSYTTAKGETKSTFTVAAAFISKDSDTKVEPSAISSAWADAGKFAIADWKGAPTEVSFSFSAGEKNYSVRVTK